jgi:hypothetical protein
MSANLAMNPAAVLTNRRHPNAQYLADGATTLARANQSDEGNLPGSEPAVAQENKHGTGKFVTSLHCCKFGHGREFARINFP